MKQYSDEIIESSQALKDLNTIALSYAAVEGNIIYSHPLRRSDQAFNPDFCAKRHNLWTLAQLSTEVMEIGFCAGHSTLIMFLANPSIKLTVFDLIYHRYTRPCYEYIKRTFNTSQLYAGDSRKGVPVFIRDYPGHKFDLIHIDGSHEEAYVRADYQNSIWVSRPGTCLVFDDTSPSGDNHINRMIQEKVAAKEIEIIDRDTLGLLATKYHEIARVL
jgi:Methyltransferase domain